MKRIVFAALVFLNCGVQNPVDTTNRDLLEQERIWQYLKTFSVWQENVPQHAFVAQNTAQLFSMIRDTLHGYSYTGYVSPGTVGSYGILQTPQPDIDAAVNSSVSTVSFDSLSDSIARLKISSFESGTHRDFAAAAVRVGRFPCIVFDVRQNPGGSLYALDSILDYILPLGTPFIKYQRERVYDQDTRLARTDTGMVQVVGGHQMNQFRNKRFAVLTDGMSASASEVLVAGLKDGAQAILVGQKTYGKGIGQLVIPRNLFGRDTVSITFLLMRGVSARIGSYHRVGIQPDTVVVNSDSLDRQCMVAMHLLDPTHVPRNIPKNQLGTTIGRSARSGLWKIATAEEQAVGEELRN